MKTGPATDEENAALVAYAAKHGRTWKSKLRDAWMGLKPHDDAGMLRRIRNTRGPSWLITYRLPGATQGAQPMTQDMELKLLGVAPRDGTEAP